MSPWLSSTFSLPWLYVGEPLRLFLKCLRSIFRTHIINSKIWSFLAETRFDKVLCRVAMWCCLHHFQSVMNLVYGVELKLFRHDWVHPKQISHNSNCSLLCLSKHGNIHVQRSFAFSLMLLAVLPSCTVEVLIFIGLLPLSTALCSHMHLSNDCVSSCAADVMHPQGPQVTSLKAGSNHSAKQWGSPAKIPVNASSCCLAFAALSRLEREREEKK